MNPGVLFDGTPMSGGSGKCGKGFRARAWAGSGAAAHRLAGSAQTPSQSLSPPSHAPFVPLTEPIPYLCGHVQACTIAH
eukprot:4510934-Prymnesium_polylepis.1